MSETLGTPGAPPAGHASGEVVHEAYSFACLTCGYGWEQAYEIAHHVDDHGHTNVVYYAGRQRVPSPLTRPTCKNCGGHLVRIMRSGRVSSAHWGHVPSPDPGEAVPIAGPLVLPGAPREARAERLREEKRRHHWFADLLAVFHRKHRDDDDPTSQPG